MATETLEHVPVLGSSEDAMAKVKGLLPEISASAAGTDDGRRVPDGLVDKMRAAGLFGVVMPKSLGGSELGFKDLVKVTVEIGTACGSSAWVYGVLAGHSWLINLFPEQAQQEIMGDPTTLLGTVFRLGGDVVPEGDGYRLTNGEGRFCSGIDYATWVIIGNGVKKEDGSFEPRFFVIPKSEIEIVDDWYTLGMKGTGSRSIKVENAFIPAHRSVALSDMIGGTTDGGRVHQGAKYRMPFSVLSPFSIVGAPLGMAKGMVQQFAAATQKRLENEDELTVAQQSTTLTRIAKASADIDAAIALVLADAEAIDSATDPSEISGLMSVQVPRNWAYAVQTARHAANHIFEAAGGSTIYDGNAMHRLFRDVNSAAQHFAFTWDTAMANYGRVAVGKEPVAFAVKKR